MKPPGQTVLRARALRRRMSLPEVLLWKALRARTQGPKFRRQHPVGPFVLDFYCVELSLAVEIDGAEHHGVAASAYDERRDRWLRSQGVQVLRIPARLVLQDVDDAVATVLGAAG